MIEQPELLIRNGYIMTMDADVGDLPRADVLVHGGRIVAVGPDLVADSAAELDASGHIILPGFVETHWHLWGSMFRGVVGDSRDDDWFATKAALAPHLQPDETYSSVLLGLAEGINGGVTTVHNWAHNILSPADADANLQAMVDAGIRGRFSYGAASTRPGESLDAMAKVMSKAGKPVDEVMDFEDIDRIQADWFGKSASSDLLSLGVALRGPSRSPAEVYRREWQLARDRQIPIVQHCAGTRAEVTIIHQVRILAAENLLGPDVGLAHCLYLEPDEQAVLAEQNTAVSVSPIAEMRSAMGFPRIHELRSAGVSVSFSFDTTAVAANADMFATMRFAVDTENARRGDPQALTPRDALAMATMEGARFLGLADTIGSITPGKRADLISVRVGDLNMAPVGDPAPALVHSAQPANVEMVMVDGQVLKTAGRLTKLDARAVAADARTALRELCERVPGAHIPALLAS